MISPRILESDIITFAPKVFIGSVATVLSFIGQAIADDKWEDLTLKGLLLFSVLYLVREIAQLRAKAEKTQTEREERLIKTLEQNTDAMRNNTETLHAQAEYFGTIVKQIVDKTINGKQPQ